MNKKDYMTCIDEIRKYLSHLNGEDNSAVKRIKNDLLDYIDNKVGNHYYLPCCSLNPVFTVNGVDYCSKCYFILKGSGLRG